MGPVMGPAPAGHRTGTARLSICRGNLPGQFRVIEARPRGFSCTAGAAICHPDWKWCNLAGQSEGGSGERRRARERDMRQLFVAGVAWLLCLTLPAIAAE